MNRLSIHRTADGWSGIYFAGTRDGNLVKIGSSCRPNKRLAGIKAEAEYQFGTWECEYLAIFPVRVRRPWIIERAIHERFSEYVVRGEWFALRPMLDFIADAKRQYREFGVQFFYIQTDRRSRGSTDERIWLDSRDSEWWSTEAENEPPARCGDVFQYATPS